MSECKSKTKLVAIYRLEFYKTQNNWKLGTSDHERGDSSKHSSKKYVDRTANLNATYCVEGPSEEGPAEEGPAEGGPSEGGPAEGGPDPLNDAFMEVESENLYNPPRMPRNYEFSQVWQEPVNIWPRGDSTDHGYTSTNNQQQYTSDELRNAGEKRLNCGTLPEVTPKRSATDRIEELVRLSRCYQEIDTKEADVYPERYGCTDFDGAARVTDWLSENYCAGVPKVVEPAQLSPRTAAVLWSAAGDVLDGRCPELPRCCPAWLGPAAADGNSARPQIPEDAERARERGRALEADSADASTDSEGVFMRGADAAPHSSQLDLSVPDELRLPAVSGGVLARLSRRQLRELQRAAARLQRALAREDEHRRLLRDSVGHHSSDSLPTRDTGLDPLLSPTPYTADRVLAGSHLARGVAGEEGRSGGYLARGDMWGSIPHYV